MLASRHPLDGLDIQMIINESKYRSETVNCTAEENLSDRRVTPPGLALGGVPGSVPTSSHAERLLEQQE